MTEEVILYDLPSKDGFCWSLNPWKTRLLMNYKGIPYKTEWVEYPDLKPTFKQFGIPPHASGPYEYTSPTVRLPSGEYVMESRAIADKLESLYPSPSVHLDSPYQKRIQELLPKVVDPVRPIFAPLVPKTFLNPPSKEYFVSTREAAIKMPLDELAKKADTGFDSARPAIKELSDMYAENPDGVFLMGKELCYADIMVLGVLRMFDRLGQAQRFWSAEGGDRLKALYDAGAKWFERDSY